MCIYIYTYIHYDIHLYTLHHMDEHKCDEEKCGSVSTSRCPPRRLRHRRRRNGFVQNWVDGPHGNFNHWMWNIWMILRFWINGFVNDSISARNWRIFKAYKKSKSQAINLLEICTALGYTLDIKPPCCGCRWFQIIVFHDPRSDDAPNIAFKELYSTSCIWARKLKVGVCREAKTVSSFGTWCLRESIPLLMGQIHSNPMIPSHHPFVGVYIRSLVGFPWGGWPWTFVPGHPRFWSTAIFAPRRSLDVFEAAVFREDCHAASESSASRAWQAEGWEALDEQQLRSSAVGIVGWLLHVVILPCKWGSS